MTLASTLITKALIAKARQNRLTALASRRAALQQPVADAALCAVVANLMVAPAQAAVAPVATANLNEAPVNQTPDFVFTSRRARQTFALAG